jgi:hypothetical protein
MAKLYGKVCNIKNITYGIWCTYLNVHSIDSICFFHEAKHVKCLFIFNGTKDLNNKNFNKLNEFQQAYGWKVEMLIFYVKAW